ncbi:MAG TPA: type IV pilus twitching motility protein PilT [Clostridiales bacterium]|nr:type IV pilus twitching motility protein PilT [Clostridiales bacterium]
MIEDIKLILEKAIRQKASDLHISPGIPPICRVNGRLIPVNDTVLTSQDTEIFIKSVLSDKQLDTLYLKGEVDASISCCDSNRFRLNAFRQKGSYSISLRLVKPEIPDFNSLGLPPVIIELSKLTKGLVLITGPTGTGKSTTLAAMIDWINTNRDAHILTLEEPIEYVHTHKKSIVNQREIGTDSQNFSSALKAALRQDPDVILIGEMRDLESIGIALTAAETGHLVLSTLHTIGSAKTIDRIIDVFPPYQQPQIRTQLSLVLQSVVSQQLIPTVDGNDRVAAVEVMISTPAIRNLIRENKTHQIFNAIQTGSKSGMKTMDNSLIELYRANRISFDEMMNYAVDHDYIKKMVT